MKNAFRSVLALAFVCAFSFAQAQDTELAKVKELFIASWTFGIKTDDKTRLLKIREIVQVGDKNFEVSAVYGILSGGQGVIPGVMISLVDKGYRLTFTTQANSRVDVYFTPEKTFKGTFVSAKGSPQDIMMTRVSEEELLALIAKGKALEDAASSVVVPEKISGRWKNNRTGYGQSFSMEKISVSGTSFSANFTQWFDSSCVARSIPITGEIKRGKVTFSFKPPCYDLVPVVTLDFVSSTGTYKFGNGGVVGSYEFK